MPLPSIVSLESPPSGRPETSAQCPRFHLLVMGADKAGKSSLLRHILGDYKITEHPPSGGWIMAPGVSSLRNPRFVMHELGYVLKTDDALKRFQRAEQFLSANFTTETFEDQVHVIWLCVEVSRPDSTSNGFDSSEIEFLKQRKVPVIVVFTRFDDLVDLMEEELSLPDNSSDDATDTLTLQRAHVRFQESCLDPLNDITPAVPYVLTSGLQDEVLTRDSKQALNNLLQTTQTLTEEYVGCRLWKSSAIPNLATASEKLDHSLGIAMKGESPQCGSRRLIFRAVYYRALLSNIWWHRLEDILGKLHRDTTRTWNLDDPMVRRDSPQFVSEVLTISSLSALVAYNKMSWPNILDRYQILITLLLGTAVTATQGRVAAGFAACLWFVHIVICLQQRLPETLRGFLEYTIHLTLLLDRIFHNALMSPPNGRPHPLMEADIRRALNEYQDSEAAAQVHSEVQLFVDEACASVWMWRGLERRRAEEFVRELVQKWKVGLQNGSVSAEDG
ncbi:hypothetical protein C8F01DRAFT_1237216 [Mycena amicta]|nr:hypothetical protein C8F01DRAFT_1237216 [Mycena amicta]